MFKLNYVTPASAEITVRSQEELDMVPEIFAGRIFIRFGALGAPAIVKKLYLGCVVACDDSAVAAFGHSFVEACDNSSVVAHDNSSVRAKDHSKIAAWDNSVVVATDNSSVMVRASSCVEARDKSRIEARDKSHVVAYDNSSVKALDSSSIVAEDDSHIVAMDYSHVVAQCSSTVEAYGNAQITNLQPTDEKIQLYGSSRIVYNPKTIEEYVSFYGIKHDEKTGHFFKAVHRLEDGTFCSDYYIRFRYAVGETIHEECDPDITKECSYGIHIANLDWALDFGFNWEDLAIIEVEANLDKVVVPIAGEGKVRTSEVKVLREVPLEECGVFGQILARHQE